MEKDLIVEVTREKVVRFSDHLRRDVAEGKMTSDRAAELFAIAFCDVDKETEVRRILEHFTVSTTVKYRSKNPEEPQQEQVYVWHKQ